MDDHIAAAATVFHAYQLALWRCCDIKLATKLWVHRTTVIPTLLYDSETGALRKAEEQQIDFLILFVFVSCYGLSVRTRSPMKLYIVSTFGTQQLPPSALLWFQCCLGMDVFQWIRKSID